MCVTPLSEGESRRNSYIWAFCRTMEGLSFSEQNPGHRLQRSRSGGAYRCRMPAIVGKLRAGSSAASSSMYRPPVPQKVTLPGPMTIAYTIDATWALSNGVYNSRKEICQDLVPILRQELVALVEAGCKHIQLDEPVFASRVNEALECGVRSVEEIFDGLPKCVAEIVSLRCGQPYSELFTPRVPIRSPSLMPATPPSLPGDYESPDSEIDLGSPALDIQDLQPLLRAKTVTLGAVRVRRCSANAEEIEAQLEEALQQFGSPLAHRTLSDEDCGLGLTDQPAWEGKMHRLRLELDRISRKHLSIPERG